MAAQSAGAGGCLVPNSRRNPQSRSASYPSFYRCACLPLAAKVAKLASELALAIAEDLLDANCIIPLNFICPGFVRECDEELPSIYVLRVDDLCISHVPRAGLSLAPARV